MANYSNQSLPKVKQVSYAEYEVERLNMIEERLMKHYGKGYSQLHKDLMRKEYSLIGV
tara:strand:- start:49 stop:222 length:174 start_codon:yes stop_codon:yes gene_type:complete